MRKSSKLLQHIDIHCSLLMLTMLLGIQTTSVSQQTPANTTEREKALQLYNENKFTEALPILDRLANSNPSDVVVISRLGFSIYATTATITDPQKRKQARERARNVLVRATELGDNSILTRATLDALTHNSEELTFSKLKSAERAMREGEAAFAQGDFSKALAAYGQALAADPHLYEAALFKGDVYFKSGQQEKAGECFAQAILIDPDRETAYRYWGDALLKQGKPSEARDKFIEAYITEPYSRLAQAGLNQWAQHTKVTLEHPRIQIPATVSGKEKDKLTVTLDPKMLSDGADDESAVWLTYGLIRAAWANTNFAKEYPNEREYRHSLREEAAALRGALEALANQRKERESKKPSPSLEALAKLDSDGVLEAYILLAIPDQGIARDFAGYRHSHRDTLRRYVTEYVVGSKTAKF